jgi:hypothetical protein
MHERNFLKLNNNLEYLPFYHLQEFQLILFILEVVLSN